MSEPADSADKIRSVLEYLGPTTRQLYAAAPDLYNAADAAATWIDYALGGGPADAGGMAALNACRDALAKARGEVKP